MYRYQPPRLFATAWMVSAVNALLLPALPKLTLPHRFCVEISAMLSLGKFPASDQQAEAPGATAESMCPPAPSVEGYLCSHSLVKLECNQVGLCILTTPLSVSSRLTPAPAKMATFEAVDQKVQLSGQRWTLLQAQLGQIKCDQVDLDRVCTALLSPSSRS